MVADLQSPMHISFRLRAGEFVEGRSPEYLQSARFPDHGPCFAVFILLDQWQL